MDKEARRISVVVGAQELAVALMVRRREPVVVEHMIVVILVLQ
ncbi:hypothetical protein B194_4698 [Serratia plymuthica A30]|nr:hypothetical protein B194_4698 [Serratia plymuthica A30]